MTFLELQYDSEVSEVSNYLIVSEMRSPHHDIKFWKHY
jgi:hypothetical protein